MRINKLRINGKRREVLPVEADSSQLTLLQVIDVSAGMRGEGTETVLELGDDHIVELVYTDGTSWLCAPDTLEELFPGRLTQPRGEEGFALPSTVAGAQGERGVLQEVVLKVLKLFTRKAAQVGMEALAKALEEKQLGTPEERGLRRITGNFELPANEADDPDLKTGPILLFIHGTNSSSQGSFGDLVGTQLWDYISKSYNGRVLAFQHETLTKSPLQNAAELVAQLPEGAELHVVTHSRGGLIGELLARCSDSSGPVIGFSEKEVAFLRKSGRDQDIGWIEKLQEGYRRNRFRVTRFVRVACPTGGTTLLSKRLDHFFNISLNLLGLVTGAAANPMYVAMKDLLAAAIDQKNDPKVLPGLEAMKPDSPFITMINNQDQADIVVKQQVMAISGSCKAKVNFKALLIIAEKLFFFEDNDLVVNTKSMYAGSQRQNRLQYFFDEGTDVDHFHYFTNKRTNRAIQFALQSTGNSSIDGFAEYSRGGPSFSLVDVQGRGGIPGLQSGQYVTGEPSGNKPIVILLPGIMGSCLTLNGSLIWIEYLRMLSGELVRLDVAAKGILSPAVIETSYRDLGDFLSDEFDVVTFPYDWRLSPQDAANLLDGRIKTLMAYKKPIHVIAHSLGGMVIRDLMVFHNDTWQKLNASDGFRLLFLGAPLRGTFRILNVLMGEDDIINKLSKVDLLHTKKELLRLFDRYPGILALLPLTTEVANAAAGDPNNDFASIGTWQRIVQALGDTEWPLPDETALRQFGVYRDTVLARMDDMDLSHAVYIAGQYPQTPCGYRIDVHKGQTELVLLSTAEGDQFVTWDSGIPKSMIAAGTVYYVDHAHGDLCSSPDMFSGIADVLRRGRTNLFSQMRPALRGDQRVFRKPQTADLDFSKEGVTRTLLGKSSSKPVGASILPLQVKVTHGDLKYAAYPILAGHFREDSILYAEKRIDDLLKGQLGQRNKLGVYPGEPGSCEVVLTYLEGRFPGAIIVGLGEPETLTAYELAKIVERAASKYLLIVNGREKAGNGFKGTIGLSSLIIGCGYGGLAIDSSVQAILQGITIANARICALYQETAKLVEEVEFIELYQSKALGCYHSVRRLGKGAGGPLRIMPAVGGLRKEHGARLKMDIDQGVEWWNRITITKKEDDDGFVEGMNFSMSTGEAREETRTLYTSGGVLERLIESISADNRWTEERARAVFELLIPNDLKCRVRKHGNIAWVLDKYSAAFPWELLQHKGEGVKPMCIGSGMIRQLATGDSRLNIESVTNHRALVVGEPQLKGFLPPLPGALAEAKAVVELLRQHHYDTLDLLGAEQDEIVTKLMSDGYKIVHLAGHGVYNADPRKPSGMVIGENSFLSTRQIAQMGDAPDLVFVNCCWLGKTNNADEEYYRSRFKLAANLGTQLIENGVKAVVVAGWKVDDSVAQLFATKFYGYLFAGLSFGESVRQAREDAYNYNSEVNTWGAYQCYGNPYYRLNDRGGASLQKEYVIAEEAEIDLCNLDSDMSTGDLRPEETLARLTAISDAVDYSDIRTPEITELEARIYKGMNKYDMALEKYASLLKGAKGGYSFEAVEQYCNLRSKLLRDRQLAMQGQLAAQAVQGLQAEFDEVMGYLRSLLLLSPTAERYCIQGSAWKRRVPLFGAQSPELTGGIRTAADSYYQAYTISGDAYSYTNWIAMENILVTAGKQKWGDAPAGVPGDAVAAIAILPTKAFIDSTLADLERAWRKKPKKNDIWYLIVPANLSLVKWMVDAAVAGVSMVNEESNVVKSYIDAWAIAGTRDTKMSEVQHLELLICALQGVAPGHFMVARMEVVATELREAVG